MLSTMSTVSNPAPEISQTAPLPSSPSPISSNKQSTLPMTSIPLSSSPATSPIMSSTLSVPKAAPTKPSRQATNPDKYTTPGTHPHGSMSTGYGGLPLGLPPAALNLSPGGVTRLGSRSPSSIPSSPTSIHSSSSAIFERDIEPLGLPSLSVPQAAPGSNQSNLITATNSHRIPRSKTTEAIEMTVPSVLDSAVSALTIAEETGTNITVLSPAAAPGAHPLSQSYSGSAVQTPLTLHPQTSPLSTTFAQPTTTGHGGIGSLGSVSGTSAGSPSPPTMSLLLQGMGMSGLVSASASVSGAAPTSGFASGVASPLSSSRAPSPARSASPPVVSNISELTPGAAAAVADAAASSTGSPKSISKDTSVFTSSPLKRPSLPPPSAGGASMPSPNMRASNRLSFISYTDLLTSTPIASQPLGTVLNPGQNEPPTHLVVVDPENPTNALGMTPTTSSGYLPLTGVAGIGSLNVGGAGDKLDVDSLGTVGLSTTGEWGREGMGGGLEERLERLWAAEREINERGRVRAPGAGTSASRSTSMGVSVAGDAPLPPPTMTMTPPATT